MLQGTSTFDDIPRTQTSVFPQQITKRHPGSSTLLTPHDTCSDRPFQPRQYCTLHYILSTVSQYGLHAERKVPQTDQYRNFRNDKGLKVLCVTACLLDVARDTRIPLVRPGHIFCRYHFNVLSIGFIVMYLAVNQYSMLL